MRHLTRLHPIGRGLLAGLFYLVTGPAAWTARRDEIGHQEPGEEPKERGELNAGPLMEQKAPGSEEDHDRDPAGIGEASEHGSMSLLRNPYGGGERQTIRAFPVDPPAGRSGGADTGAA